MKIMCPVCEKVVSAYVPKGGDGSAFRPYRHGDCEGRFELVEEIYSEAHLTKRAPDRGYALAKKKREAKERELYELLGLKHPCG